MNIGIVLPYLKRRGTEKQTLRISSQFKSKGLTPIIFNVQAWGDFAKEFIINGIQVINVGEPDEVGERSVNLGKAERLTALIAYHQCDIVLSRAGMGHQITLEAVRRLNKKIPVVLVWSGPVYPISDNLIARLKTKIKYEIKYRTADQIVTVSEEGENNLRAYFPLSKSKVRAIVNGVDTNKIYHLSQEYSEVTLDSNVVNISFVGSLDIRRKGLDTLLESINQLLRLDSSIPFKLNIVGAGADSHTLNKYIQESGLNNYVLFHGEIQNPYTILRQTDIFVLPSRREGMPNALLEAMSLGLASVSTNCMTGPAEIITDNENGLLVDVGDSAALAEAIHYLINNKEERIRIGSNAKESIYNKFTIEKMIDGYLLLIKQLVNDSF